MIRFLPAVCIWMLALLVASFLPLNTQTKPPSSKVPDEIAYTALFHVVYDAPKPHWDRETCVEWLKERGLSWQQALLVIEAANRYMRMHKDVEEELANLHRQTQNLISTSTDTERALLESRRLQEMREVVADLNFTMRQKDADGEKVIQQLLEEVKRNVRMKEAQKP